VADHDDFDGDLTGRLLASLLSNAAKAPEAITDSVLPSTFIPKAGDYFRMRFATIRDRSYMDCIWKCLAHQDGAVLCELAHGNAFGKGPRLFVIGDVLFYDCNELYAAIQSPRAELH